MTTVYRAHSPSRDDTHGLTEDRDEMVATVAVLNQGARLGLYPPDWIMQTGHVEWETP